MKALLAGLGNEDQRYISALRAVGLVATTVTEERAELAMDVESFEVVVCNSLFQYNDISRFTALKYIQLTSAGLDRVPL
ncbi:MAG: NAD(P)-dependent oxidoreductase, partial [Coriobacteriia bacterium]